MFIFCLYVQQRGSFISLIRVPWWCEAAGLQDFTAWNIFFNTFQFLPSHRLLFPHVTGENRPPGSSTVGLTLLSRRVFFLVLLPADRCLN